MTMARVLTTGLNAARVHDSVIDADGFEPLHAFPGTGRVPDLHVELERPVPSFHVPPAALCPVSRRSLDDGAAPGNRTFQRSRRSLAPELRCGVGVCSPDGS